MISTISYPTRFEGSFKLSLDLLRQILYDKRSNNLIFGKFNNY